MQRLVDKIYKEFSMSEGIEVNALDGNGDSFLVYQGALPELNSFHFANILRHPGCFYFFNVSTIIEETPERDDFVIRRDLCWLTDPLPPNVQLGTHNSLDVSWEPVSFCGIQPPSVLDSVIYSLQIAEGIEYKEGYFSKFINDAGAVDYITVSSGTNVLSARIEGLRPALWYHLRVVVEYLGCTVMSETKAVHTVKWSPSAPGMPRLHVVPVRSSFDLKTDIPARLDVLITWPTAMANGSKITKYQLQIQRFDENGHVIPSKDALKKRARQEKQKALSSSFEAPSVTSPTYNQWTRSPGHSPVQIHNSLTIGNRSQLRSSKSSRGKSRSHSRQNSPSRQQESSLFASDGDSALFASTMDPSADASNAGPFNGNVSGGSEGRENGLHSSNGGHFGTSSGPDATRDGRRTKWEVVYENLSRSVKLGSPRTEEAEWHLRVRAKNSGGWSPFSDYLKVNSLNFPSLFAAPPPQETHGSTYLLDDSRYDIHVPPPPAAGAEAGANGGRGGGGGSDYYSSTDYDANGASASGVEDSAVSNGTAGQTGPHAGPEDRFDGHQLGCQGSSRAGFNSGGDGEMRRVDSARSPPKRSISGRGDSFNISESAIVAVAQATDAYAAAEQQEQQQQSHAAATAASRQRGGMMQRSQQFEELIRHGEASREFEPEPEAMHALYFKGSAGASRDYSDPYGPSSSSNKNNRLGSFGAAAGSGAGVGGQSLPLVTSGGGSGAFGASGQFYAPPKQQQQQQPSGQHNEYLYQQYKHHREASQQPLLPRI